MQHPAVLRQKRRSLRLRRHGLAEIHLDKTRRVPNLIREVSRGFHSLPVEAHVVARRIAGHQREAQCVRAVAVNDFERIDAVAERLGHLSALRVAHQSVNQHRVERQLAGLLDAGEDHADDPEEDDVIAGHEHIGRVEIAVLGRILRPAEGRERPECRTEPGVERILFLTKAVAAAVRTGLRHLARHDRFAALVAVISRDPVTPPELAGDAPVVNALEPV